MSNQRIDKIRGMISWLTEQLRSRELEEAARVIPGCRDKIDEFRRVIEEVVQGSQAIPRIDVALLGPSRHGKSSLINALAGVDLLPTSDIKPCTASIVKLQWAESWSAEFQFVLKQDFVDEWGQAVKDAQEYLRRYQHQMTAEEQPDNPRYLVDLLQRFIELFRIDPNLDPHALVEQVRTAEIPKEQAKLLGKLASKPAQSFAELKAVAEKYLSTKDVLWTIVDSCTLRGPFANWHPMLGIVDLPGTNDTNPHRANLTNSLREKARAVAIVTRDSNLGVDIESWLRNSTVLTDFLEATESRRQHLCIVRTQLDSYQPEVAVGGDGTLDEHEENRLFQAAIENYKTQQRLSYHTMLRNIVSPMLPMARESKQLEDRRELLLKRIAELPVFFVSSLAYDVFENRAKVTAKQQRNLREHFDNDPANTGIPGLLQFLNHTAEEYLQVNFYADLERRLEKEYAQMGRFFSQQRAILEAAKAGAGQSILGLTTNVRREVVPWIRTEITSTIESIRQTASEGSDELKRRLKHAWEIADIRFKDKLDKWNNYAWNSLKAAARKRGTHQVYGGNYIDINQDICGVLVDDLILIWTTYRDELIDRQINRVTQDFAAQLIGKLRVARDAVEDQDARFAIDQITQQLESVAQLQRDELLRRVAAKIRELESIRRPAYEFIQRTFEPTFQAIAAEFGVGCQQRMRQKLVDGFRHNISAIRSYINDLVRSSADGLLSHCATAMSDFGSTAASRITSSLDEVEILQRMRDEREITGKITAVDRAIRLLPPPATQL